MNNDTAISEASYHAVKSALRQVTLRAPQARVLVVGDVMLDEFVFGAVQRISPEAPVPIVEITGRRFATGGAANVASNVRALGAGAALGGVTGADDASDRFRGLVEPTGVDTSAVLCDASRPTVCKTRIVAGGQQIVRIDHESREPLSGTMEQRLIEAAVGMFRHADACVISDYGKGVVSARLVGALVEEAKAWKTPVLVDPKGHDYRKYSGVTLVTPNLKEAELAAGRPIANNHDMVLAAERILDIVGCPSLLITQGALGMTLFRPGQAPLHSAALAHQVFDVTGAGDTVVAMLAVGLAAGIAIEEAVLLANIAASIVVKKPGTATVSLDEMAESMEKGWQPRPGVAAL